jgi:hypothetical protein
MDLSSGGPLFFCGVIPSSTKFRGGISQGGSQIAVSDSAPDTFDFAQGRPPMAGEWDGKEVS